MKKFLLVLLSLVSLTCFLTACNQNDNVACSHSYSEWNIVDEATCLEDGLKSHTCSKCGDIETQTIEAFGHTEVVDARVEPTCTSTGLTEGKHCSVCSKILIAQNNIPVSHTDGEWITDAAPTCTINGRKHLVCSICNETIRNETITATGHTAGEWVIDINSTCTEKGSRHQECSVCSASIKTDIIPATGHHYLSVKIEPTKNTKGYTNHKCSCGDEYNDNYVDALIVITQGDKIGPELISFTLDKPDVRVGDIINFTAEISDESSIYCAEFQFKLGADWHNVFLEHINENTYKGQLKITNSFVNGTYTISWIYLNDYANNSSRPQSDASFTVTNENSKIVVAQGDKTGPVLLSFTLDKTEVKVGDIIYFTAEINDESSINCAQFQFKLGADWHNVFLDHISGNTYKGQLRITNDFAKGIYSISRIYLQDYANNSSYPQSDITFTVVK